MPVLPRRMAETVSGVAWSAPGPIASTPSPRVRHAATVSGRDQLDAQPGRIAAQEDRQQVSVVDGYARTWPIQHHRLMPH
jgi:hypothetical protein